MIFFFFFKKKKMFVSVLFGKILNKITFSTSNTGKDVSLQRVKIKFSKKTHALVLILVKSIYLKSKTGVH